MYILRLGLDDRPEVVHPRPVLLPIRPPRVHRKRSGSKKNRAGAAPKCLRLNGLRPATEDPFLFSAWPAGSSARDFLTGSGVNGQLPREVTAPKNTDQTIRKAGIATPAAQSCGPNNLRDPSRFTDRNLNPTAGLPLPARDSTSPFYS